SGEEKPPAGARHHLTATQPPSSAPLRDLAVAVDAERRPEQKKGDPTEKLDRLKVAEIKHARLAMVAMLIFYFEAAQGKTPLGALGL
ncbi:hypothetical protein Dimus_008466, partial [Dionaea muscipula]